MNNEEQIEKIIPDTTDEAVTGEIHEQDDVAFEEVNEEGEVNVRDTVKKLRAKIKELEQESKSNLDGWTRAKADYANFKREVDARRSDDIVYANKRLIEDLLPTLDAYTMAQSNKEAWEKVDANWRVGIEYIFTQLMSTLEKEGLTAFGAIGDTFDPMMYESVEMVPEADAAKKDTVALVLARGYKLGTNLIRPAKVKVYGEISH